MSTMVSNKVSSTSSFTAMVIGAIGVVYGDIGTSPLYTLKEVFAGHHAIQPTEVNVLGILSTIFWSLIIVVSLKYIMFVMRADNNGEGGVMALTALAIRNVRENQRQYMFIMALGILGAALFYGDSVITPAISVLSAVEGLKVAEPGLHELVIPLTLAILVALFLFQQKGTATVGKFFGPVMMFWFLVIAVLGFFSIIEQPRVLHALNPYYALIFFEQNFILSFVALGAVFLALTGAEALYADMGHFGRGPIRIAWFWLILPALGLNYFGQGALLLQDPTAAHSPFYLLAPEWALYALVALATIATIIASQSVISGAFSMTQQAIRLGYLPRLEIRYTSEQEMGQIYVPVVNWLLFFAVIMVVLIFESSDNLAAAYGLSVTGTMIITTVLAFRVIRHMWKWTWWHSALIFGFFLLVDLSFFSANLIKIMEGGWLPLLIALIVFTIMITWRHGTRLLIARVKEEAVPLSSFLHNIPQLAPIRVPGTAVFLTSDLQSVPRPLMYNLMHNKVLHDRVVVLKVEIEDVPHVTEDERVEIAPLSDNFYTILIRFGFKDVLDVPKALQLCESKGLSFSLMETSFFLGKETLFQSKQRKMLRWRERVFMMMFRNAGSLTSYFKIPPNRVVALGTQMEL
ncbi:MAG: potassium transporter Kup [Gammaproteobacteria bacterium]